MFSWWTNPAATAGVVGGLSVLGVHCELCLGVVSISTGCRMLVESRRTT